MSGGIVRLVARREIRERVHSRAFRAGTAVQVLVVAAIVIVSSLTSGSEPEKFDVGVVGPEAGAVAAAAEARQDSFDVELTDRDYDDAQAARAAVAADTIQAALTADALVTQEGGEEAALEELLQSANRAVRSDAELRRLGLDSAERRAALDPPALRSEEVATGADEGGEGLAFIGVLFLYIALLSFGYTLASGVVEEKSSRVVEIIVSAIKPVELLAGKIVGIGFTGLAQMLVVAGVGVAIAAGIGEVELPASTGETIVLVLIYFVLGYAFYAAAFAVAGAIVSRPEDTQSTTTPLLILLVGAYLASLGVVDDPDSTLAEVGTFLPPLAPMIVPARAAQDALPLWELLASVALMVVASALLLRLGARIYERSVMRFGSPMKLSQAFRLARR